MPLSNNPPPPPFLKRVNLNGEVSNKLPSRISHEKKEKEMMLIVMKYIYIQWKFAILSFVFLKTSFKMAVFLFHFLQLVV